MYRLKPIRVTRSPRLPRALFKGADVAFWIVLLLAVSIGGGRALAGIPALLSMILPPIAAQASGVPSDGAVTLQIEPAIGASHSTPQVLYPLVAH